MDGTMRRSRSVLKRAVSRVRSELRAQGTVAGSERTRALVLHGWRSNARVSQIHCNRLRAARRFDKAHCVCGTEEAPEAAMEAMESLIDGPWYSWVDDARGSLSQSEDERAEKLLLALRAVVRFVREHGPYDCAVGFSQGGAIVSLLSNPDVLRALGIEDGFLWRTSVVCCGASASLFDLAFKVLGVRTTDLSKSPIPSLHIYGFQDAFKPEGERLMQTFESRDGSGALIRHCLYFDGGHDVPASLESDVGFHDEFDAWYESATQSQLSIHNTSGEDSDVMYAPALDYISHKMETPSTPNEDVDLERGDGARGTAAKTTTFATADALIRGNYTKSTPNPGGNELIYALDKGSLIHCNVLRNASRLSILDFLAKAPEDAVLLRSMDGASMSYGNVIEFIISGPGDVRKVGADANTIFAYNVPPGPVGALAFLAITSQCTAVPLDPGIAENEAYEALTSCHVSLLTLFRDTNTEAIEKAASRAGIPIKWYVITENDTGYAGYYSPESPESPVSNSIAAPSEGTGLLLRTSGTTSKSKVVPLVIGALTSNGATLAASLELKPSDVCINVMPLFHIGGLSASILATIAAHGSVICCPKFDAQVFYDVVTSSSGIRPTWYSAIPTIHLAVLQYGKAVSQGMCPSHCLRFIRSGAAALSHADAEKLNEFWGVPIVPTYSMSEQMPISGKGMHMMLRDRQDTVGQSLCCSVALVEDGHCRVTQPFGQQGELTVNGDNVMSEYRDAFEANNKTYFYIGEKRYLRTGDIAKIDGDGFIYLTGRSKELIKRGGEQVSPLKVEAVLVQHSYVRVAVVFSVPSPLWGEEVGAAVVLNDSFDGTHEAALKSIKHMVSQSKELSRFEIPVYWKIVADEDLPKTSTKKYKRAGLAAILDVTKAAQARVCDLKPAKKVVTTSTGLTGLRYCMAVGVMFNHFGGVWQGEDERNPLAYGPYWWSAKATTFYFPATTFFVLGGFTLSAALSGKEVKRGTWLSFYNSRFQTLVPLYLFSVLCGLINMLIVCRPDTYSAKFSWQPHEDTYTLASGGRAQCYSGPVEMPYGAWFVMTTVVFSIGLQTWFPLWLLSSWFMYYTWFNGVYYFIILVFPYMQNALARVKGDVKAVTKWFIFYTIGIWITAGILGVYFAFPPWEEYEDLHRAKSWEKNAQNIYALSTMMFPPYWVPCVGAGMASYFWFDAVRPGQSHRRALYGRLADILTLAFIAYHLAHFLDINWPYPTNVAGKMWEVTADEHHNWSTGIKRYVWSVMTTRLYSPLIAAWVALLATPGGSITTRILENQTLTKTLAPKSYGCFLFHQLVCQWYWWATRSGNNVHASDVGNKYHWSWWAYPKEYYWFSPQPLPVAWYEFFFIVGLVTLFSGLVDKYLNSPLTVLWIRFIDFFQNIIWPGSVKTARRDTEALTPEQSVLNAVVALTGVDEKVSMEDSFDEIGLVSVGLPILVGLINASEQAAVISAPDIANCANLKEVVQVVARKRNLAQNSAGVGTNGANV
ncbi:AMP-dependent synthetase/ligase [Ostreococcus tauri]|uniref:AMP-dependent synthetase/ligase n=1 Tax=Ostreococcus tauri TaxID=70448 RepID=A0A090M526_OSTTA|nr:AMP-dependent synthetase/ligase [Ostreococcus tauri]CEF97782.1 AMP-dependent synthetase/ligase [Ostreococcus tauri]|eukprot:XP_003079071.2 AMP-dependent synthetase/ligase [Ostreococcus tauri]